MPYKVVQCCFNHVLQNSPQAIKFSSQLREYFKKQLFFKHIKQLSEHLSLPRGLRPGRVSTVVSKMSSKNITCTTANAATAGIATQS